MNYKMPKIANFMAPKNPQATPIFKEPATPKMKFVSQPSGSYTQGLKQPLSGKQKRFLAIKRSIANK